MKKKVSLMILATIPLIITSQARALNLTPTKFAELDISHAYVVGEYLFNSDKGFSPELRDVMIASRSIHEGEKTTYYDIQYDEEENTYSKEVHIKVKFNELKKVRAISLYDSSNYSYSLNNIDKITINDKVVVNIPMKESYISGYKIPSSSFIYEFDEIETDEINIYLSSENTIYLNELMILGK